MTTQLPDEIILPDSDVVGSVYLPLPADHPEIEWCTNVHGSIYDSTACWSGHSARWTLSDERIYLIELLGHKRLKSTTSLAADWLNGNYFIHFGKHIAWIVEDLLTERCLAAEIVGGRVVRSALWIDDREDDWSSFYSRKRFQHTFLGKPSPPTDDASAWIESERVEMVDPNDPFGALGSRDA